jgi:hypothetical protein
VPHPCDFLPSQRWETRKPPRPCSSGAKFCGYLAQDEIEGPVVRPLDICGQALRHHPSVDHRK